jgi:hypothetical protein
MAYRTIRLIYRRSDDCFIRFERVGQLRARTSGCSGLRAHRWASSGDDSIRRRSELHGERNERFVVWDGD